MAAGFSMLEAGLVRSKNVTMQLTKNIGLFSIAAIMYYLIGYNLMYPLATGRWTDEANVLGAFGPGGARSRSASARCGDDDLCLGGFGLLLPADVLRHHRLDRVGHAGRAHQAVAVPDLHRDPDRLIYPIQASWKWGGGFLDSQFGFLDFAGSTVVHSVGGWAALAGAIVLGAA
jgi:Amt family ammonium transporter